MIKFDKPHIDKMYETCYVGCFLGAHFCLPISHYKGYSTFVRKWNMFLPWKLNQTSPIHNLLAIDNGVLKAIIYGLKCQIYFLTMFGAEF